MNAFLAAARARLIDDVHCAARFWSVRINAAGIVLLPLLLVPDMPAPIQELFPPGARAIIAGLWCAAAIAARLIAQRKV